MYRRNLCSRRTLEAILMAAVMTVVNAGAPAMVLAETEEVEIITDVVDEDVDAGSDIQTDASSDTILLTDENGNEVEMSMEEYEAVYGTDDTDITEPVLNLGGESDDEPTLEEKMGPRPTYDVTKFVKLGDYENLTVTVFPKTEVTGEDVDYEIHDRVLYSDQLEKIEEGGVENGDNVTIDYTAEVDGKVIDELGDTDFQFPLGDGYFWDEFENAILDAQIGETVSVVITMDEEWYDEEVAGKDTTFNITLKAKYIIPEYTDDLAQKLTDGEAQTWDAYREMVQDELVQMYEDDFNNTVTEAIQEELVKICEIESYPEDVLTYDMELSKANYEQYAQMFGMEMDEFIAEYMDMDADGYEEQIRMECEENLKREMIYEAIIQEEDLRPTEEEMDQQIADMAEAFGFESADEFIEMYTRKTIETSILYESVDEFLRGKATVIEDENLFDDEMFFDEEGVPLDFEDLDDEEAIDEDEELTPVEEPIDHDA